MGETRAIGGNVSNRRKQRGSVLIIAMIALVALAGLGGFTALSVQGGVSAQSAARFQSMALYAAESGVAAGMEFLRNNIDPVRNWTAFVDKNNVNPPKPAGIRGNEDKTGDSDFMFTTGYRGSYQVSILNNESDPGFGLDPPAILDTDARLTLRVVGFGPNGAAVTLEVDITANNADALTGQPCSYEAQQGLGAQNAGIGCITGDIDTTGVPKTFVAP